MVSVGRSAQRLSDRLLSAHVPDDRRTQVRAHQGPAVGAERDVVDRARVGRERGAVRRAGLRVPHEDRPFERSRGQQPSVRAEIQRGGRLARRPTAAGRPVVPFAMSTMDTEPESSLAISVRPPSAKIAASTSALPIASGSPTRRPVATSQIPTVPGAPGTAIRFESGLKEIDCAPPVPGGLVDDRPADHPTGRGVPQRDVVRLLPARGDDAAVGAVADDGERGLSGVAAAGSVSSRSSFLGRDVPQLDAALSARDRQRPPVGAEVDPLPAALRRSQRRADGLPRRRVPERGPVAASRSRGACRPGLNAVALTGESNPWSHARIREPCSSAPGARRGSRPSRRGGPPRAREGAPGRDASPRPRATGRRGVLPGRRSPCAARVRAGPARTIPRSAPTTSAAATPASRTRRRRARRRAFRSSRVLRVPARLRGTRVRRGRAAARRPPARPRPPAADRGRDRRRRVPSPPRSEPPSSGAGGRGAPPDPPPTIRAAAATHGSAPRGRSRPSRRPRPGAASPPAARGPRRPPPTRSSGISSDQRDAPSGVLRRLAQLGEPEEHPPHEHLLLLGCSPGRPPRPSERSLPARRRPHGSPLGVRTRPSRRAHDS